MFLGVDEDDTFVFRRVYQFFCAFRLPPYNLLASSFVLSLKKYAVTYRFSEAFSESMSHIRHHQAIHPPLVAPCPALSPALFFPRKRRGTEHVLGGESTPSRSILRRLYLFNVLVSLFLKYLGRHRLRCCTYETLEFLGRDSFLEHFMDLFQGAAACFRQDEVYEQKHNSV